jgi:hypothetical protein
MTVAQTFGALLAHERKKIAEATISHVLTAIERGAWPDGLYERNHIQMGLGHLRRGYYQHAWAEGLLAAARMNQDPELVIPKKWNSTTATIENLRKDFAAIQAEPPGEWVALP